MTTSESKGFLWKKTAGTTLALALSLTLPHLLLIWELKTPRVPQFQWAFSLYQDAGFVGLAGIILGACAHFDERYPRMAARAAHRGFSLILLGAAWLNAWLALSGAVVRTLLESSDPMPDLSVQSLDLIRDYATPGALLTLALTTLALIFLPGHLSRLKPVWSQRWNLIGLPLVGVYAGLGAFLFAESPAAFTLPLHHNPLFHFFSSTDASEGLIDSKTPGTSPRDLKIQLQQTIPMPQTRLRSAAVLNPQSPSNVIFVILESTGMRALQRLASLKREQHQPEPFMLREGHGRYQFLQHHAQTPHSESSLHTFFCGVPRIPGRYSMPAPACISLPRLMGEAGVQTALFQSTYFGDWLTRSFFESLGFETLRDSLEMIQKAKERAQPIRHRGKTLHEAETVSNLLDWAHARCAAKEPFFGVYYSAIPHVPYDVRHAPELSIPASLPSKLRHARLIQLLDQQVERIWNDLHTTNCGRPFTLVVTGDHGEAFREHAGNRWHSEFDYEENLHVPLVFMSDDGIAGASNLPTDHMDLAPTLLELTTGKPSPLYEKWGGQPLLRSPSLRPLFSSALLNHGKLAVRWGPWKWIRSPRGGELYDISQDPEEKQNLKETRIDIARVLDATLAPWTNWVRDEHRRK